MKRNLVIFVNGGLGKQLCAARVLYWRWIQCQEQVGVVSGFPEVWEGHPGVYTAAHPGDLSACRALYAKADVLTPEPYSDSAYRFDLRHLILSYCDLLEVVPGEPPLPYLCVTEEQKTWAAQRLVDFVAQSGEVGEPVAVMPFGMGAFAPGLVRSFSIESGKKLVALLRQHGCVVIQFRGPTDYKLPGVISPDLDLKYALPLVSAFKKIISVDTWLHHAAAALGIRSLVFWGATSSQQLGHSLHQNTSKKTCPIGPCQRPALVFPDPFICPYDRECMEWEDSSLATELETYLEL